MSAKKVKRASYATRAFGHYMDVGGVKLGTWIISVMELETALPMEDVKGVLEDRLLTMSRFRSVLQVSKSTAGFKEVEEIDWEYHLTTAFEGEEPEQEDVLKFLEDIFSFGLDKDKPLWRCIVVPKLSNGSCNIIMVFNHAISDGIAAIGVLFKIIDDSPIDPTLPFSKQQTDMVVKKRKTGPPVSAWTKFSMFFTGVSRALAGPLATPDKQNSFRLKVDINNEKEYTGKKCFGRAEDMSLQDIKDIKNKFLGATVNDVLLALMTIAVRNFLEEVEDPILKNGGLLRGNIPVSLRAVDEALLKGNDPCNRWAPFAFRFPLDYKSPVDCVWRVKDIVDSNKVSPELPVLDSLARSMLNNLPRSVVLPNFIKQTTKASMMLSNVPGPQKVVHLAGLPVQDLSFYLIAPMGTYLGVLSYNGKVQLTVNFDESLGIDTQTFLKFWGAALEELSAEVSQFEEMIPRTVEQRKKYLDERVTLET